MNEELTIAPLHAGQALPKYNSIVPVDNSPSGLLRLAVDRNLDTEKLRELMALEREYLADIAKAAFNSAMAKFVGLKKNIKYNRKGKAGKEGAVSYGYSDYPQMVQAVTPWMEQCGLSFTHLQESPVMGDKGILWVNVVCVIKHAGGHSESNSFPAMTDARLLGSVSPSQLLQMAVTYAKRQTLAMGLGLATSEDANDDDSSRVLVPIITEKQAADLHTMMEDFINNKKSFLAWLKVESLSELPASKYQMALDKCEAARKRRGAK